jgi:hypothetical protein
VTWKLPPALALELPGAPAGDPPAVPDPLEEHPATATATEVAAAATQAAIHLCLFSIVAQTSTFCLPRTIA